MTVSTIIIAILGAAGLILAASLYLRTEPSVPARGLLLALRLTSLAIVTLLLLGIEIPGPDPTRPAPEGGKWVLLDPDFSMTLSSNGEPSLWEEAVDLALAEAGGDGRLAIALPGEAGPESLDPQALSRRSPMVPIADLRVAVARLAEAGADSVVLVSTLRRRSEELEALQMETRVPLRLVRMGGSTRNLGISELSLPARASGEEELEGQLGLFGEGGSPGDSALVEIRADGEIVRLVEVAVPSPGQEVSIPIALPAPPDSGLVRYTARGLLDGDAFPADDLRARWVVIGRPDRGILLVSLSPDWEPRVLLPVLAAVTGLSAEGYLRLGDGRFIPLVREGERVNRVEPEEVRDRLAESEILVIHGSAADTPEWLSEQIRLHPRVLFLPSTPEGAELAGLNVDAAREGEWAVAGDLPPSPLSPFIVGLSLGGLPPLSRLLTASDPPGTTALQVQGPRDGELHPVLLLQEGESGRRVLALADGFWRWGMREGEGRQAYRALWGGVTGWLLERPADREGELVQPASLVQARGEALTWSVASTAGDVELTLTRLHDGDDGPLEEASPDPDPRFRGSLLPQSDGTATIPSIEPGIYRFSAHRPEAPGDSVLGSGLIEVEAWAGSLRRPPLETPAVMLPNASTAESGGPEGGRPLRTHPLPYLLLLVLLGAEWLGRRKVGLR